MKTKKPAVKPEPSGISVALRVGGEAMPILCEQARRNSMSLREAAEVILLQWDAQQQRTAKRSALAARRAAK
jgi:hypothetical protein